MEPKDPRDDGQEPDNVGTANAGDEQAADIVSRVGEESPDVEHDERENPKGESEPT